jgi:hypothetical protein
MSLIPLFPQFIVRFSLQDLFDVLLDAFGLYRATTRAPNPAGKATPLEEVVNILQLQALGLREEDEDDGYPKSVGYGEYDENAPGNVLNSRRSHVNNRKNAQPIEHRRNRRSACTNARRGDLRCARVKITRERFKKRRHTSAG